MTFALRRAGFLPTLALLAAFGCSSGTNTVSVSGTVTWNGNPMPDGYIILQDAGGKPIEEAGPIKAGSFSFQARPGAKRVQVRANREIPGAKFDPAMGAVPRQQYIPERYNDKTILTATVTPGGIEPSEFKLTDKP